MTLHLTTGTLTPTPPFDFDQTLRFVARFNPRQVDEGTAVPRTIAQAIRVQGQTVVFQAASTGTIEAPHVAYTLHAAQPLSPAGQAAAADRLSFYLSLHDDLREFYALARDDPPFLPVLDALYGYHQVKFLTPFENAIWAILTQRNQWTNARRMAAALIRRYGAPLTVGGQEYWAYPEPAVLAQAGPEELMATIRHQPKGAQLAGVARAFAGVDEHFLRSAPYAEVEAWLLAIPGIGPWSASFVLLRGLGRPQRLPAGDRYIQAGFQRFYGPANFAERADHYGDWCGYWGHYLRAMD
jgi:DNA-3-methyladenine glycosylase II